jgi:hypothetical protein
VNHNQTKIYQYSTSGLVDGWLNLLLAIHRASISFADRRKVDLRQLHFPEDQFVSQNQTQGNQAQATMDFKGYRNSLRVIKIDFGILAKVSRLKKVLKVFSANIDGNDPIIKIIITAPTHNIFVGQN